MFYSLWIKKQFSVVLMRTVLELRGESCLDLEDPEESRCTTCDWAGLCPNGTGDDDLPEGGEHQPPGDLKVYDLTPFADLVPRVNIFCEVFSVTNVPEKAPNITIKENGGFAFVRIIAEESEGVLTYPENLQKGKIYQIINRFIGFQIYLQKIKKVKFIYYLFESVEKTNII